MSFTLCSNHLYLRNHYHLYFNLLLLITSQIVFILIIIIITIIIKINLPFSLSKLLKLWLSLQLLRSQYLTQLSQLRTVTEGLPSRQGGFQAGCFAIWIKLQAQLAAFWTFEILNLDEATIYGSTLRTITFAEKIRDRSKILQLKRAMFP